MTSITARHDRVKGYILTTANTVPENSYAFNATPDVRGIAQLLALGSCAEHRELCRCLLDR